MADYSERSPLWDIAGTAAFAGGIGYGIYSNRSAILDALRSSSGESIISSAMRRAANFSSYNLGAVSKVADTTGESLKQAALNMEGSASFIRGNIRQAAFESLMSTRSMVPESALESLSVLNQMKSPLDIYNAALSVVESKGGDFSVFSSRISDYASSGVDRLSMFSNVVPSAGEMQSINPSFMKDVSKLTTSELQRFQRLQTNIKAANSNDFLIGLRLKEIEDVVGGNRVSSRMAVAELDNLRIAVPLTETPDFIYGGRNFTTRYTPRQAYTVGGKLMSYSDLAESLLTDSISKAGNMSQLKDSLNKAHSQLIENMWERDAAARSAAIWSLPEPVMTSGARARANIIRQEAIPFGVETKDYENVFGKGLFPYTSPNAAAKGTFTTTNIAEDLFGPLGRLISAEQRPTQFIRQEWGATEAAKQSARSFKGLFGSYFNRVDRKIQGERYKSLLYSGYDPLSAEAYSAPQLFTFYAKPGTGDGIGFASERLNQMMSAEEGVISSHVGKMMEYERVVQKKILLNKDLMVNENLLTGLRGRKFGEFVRLQNAVSPGNFIGIERDTGREISLRQEQSFAESLLGAELTSDTEATVFIKERRNLAPGEYWKMFSEENKYMMSLKGDREFTSYLEAAGLTKNKIAGQRIEAIQSGKLVARNKMALINQQIEATSAFLTNRVDKGFVNISPEISSFLENPIQSLGVKELLTGNAVNVDIQIQKNLIGIAKQHDFNQLEMQRTFGLMSKDALSAMVGSNILTSSEAEIISKSRGVIGLGKGRLGDLASGAWGRGSFEQTGFRMLSMKGDEGLEFAGELSKRLLGKGELLAADKLTQTLLGQESFLTKFKRSGLDEFAQLNNLTPDIGGYFSIGRKIKAFGGSDVLYLPGMDEASGLMMGSISGDKMISSPLVSEFKSFQSVLRKFNKGLTDENELEYAATNLRNIAVRISEEQASARGKIIGSQILTGIRKNFTEDPDVFRISKASGQRMFEDLIERAAEDQRSYLLSQKEAFLGGETLVGGMWRHPTSGPESFQFVKYKLGEDLAVGTMNAPTQFAQLDIHGLGKRTVDVSPMVGFAGDFDRDQYVLSAIAEKSISDKVGKKIDNQIRTEYTNYLFNHYGMKDIMEGKVGKATDIDVNSINNLTQGWKKLTTAKTTTGQVNIALQKLKLGLQSSAPEEYRPLADVFFHLEQAAIGGKHGVLETDLYKAIASATEGGRQGRKTMENVLTSLFGEELSLKGSITNAMGRSQEMEFNLNMKKAADIAISSYDAVSRDVDLAMSAASIAKGKEIGDVSLNNLVEQFYSRRTGSIDIAQSLMEGNIRDISTFTARANRTAKQVLRKQSLVLNALEKAKKPMLIGAAAAAGIAFLSPSISGKLSPESIGLPEGVRVESPPPRMNASPRVYDFGSIRNTTHGNIKMRINDFNSNGSNFSESVHSLNGRTSIQMNDDRAILNPQRLANKIHERL